MIRSILSFSPSSEEREEEKETKRKRKEGEKRKRKIALKEHLEDWRRANRLDVKE